MSSRRISTSRAGSSGKALINLIDAAEGNLLCQSPNNEDEADGLRLMFPHVGGQNHTALKSANLF